MTPPDGAIPLTAFIPIMFIARPEPDGTYTLLIDAPGTETLPVELGRGYTSPDQITQALFASLAAPAVAEDRMVVVEESIAPVNSLIDEVNAKTEEIAALNDAVAELQQQVRGLIQQMPSGQIAIRPRIPRIGESVPVAASPPFRAKMGIQVAPVADTRAVGRAPRHPVGPSAHPGGIVPEPEDKPSFERGTFVAHRPVGGVGRGPGSER